MKLCLRAAQETRRQLWASFNFLSLQCPELACIMLGSSQDCQPGGWPGDVLCTSTASILDSHTSCAPLVSTALPLCRKAGGREQRSVTAAFLPPQRPSEPGPRIWALLENCTTGCAFAGRPTKVSQLLTHSTDQSLKARHTHKGARCSRTTLLHRCR